MPGRRRKHLQTVPEDVRAAPLMTYDPTFLACRDVMHAWPTPDGWSWHRVVDDHATVHGYSRTMMCTRCHTIARDVIDARTGESHRQYRYPEGYSMPRGQAVSRREVRVEQLRRVVEHLADDQLVHA